MSNNINNKLVFTDCWIYVREYSKLFTWINSFNPHHTFLKWAWLLPLSRDEGTGAQRHDSHALLSTQGHCPLSRPAIPCVFRWPLQQGPGSWWITPHLLSHPEQKTVSPDSSCQLHLWSMWADVWIRMTKGESDFMNFRLWTQGREWVRPPHSWHTPGGSVTSDNKNLRQSSLDVLGRPPQGGTESGCSAPGSWVPWAGLRETTSQSSPLLPTVRPHFSPRCAFRLDRWPLGPCQPVPPGPPAVSLPLAAPGRSRGSVVWLLSHPQTPGP